MKKEIIIIAVIALLVIASVSIGLNIGLLMNKQPSGDSGLPSPTSTSQSTVTPTKDSQLTTSPTATTRPVESNRGLMVGDYFTYGITGTETLQSIDAKMTSGFEQYNQTDYYKVTITGINRDVVSLDTVWRFLNGTEVTGQQTLNLTDGSQSVQNGFWGVYLANSNVGDRIRPTDDRLTVNQTDTKTYADSSRPRNFWSIENKFFDVNDPTHNTLRDDYTGVWFDKQTGMLETLNSVTYYNNPLKTEAITWKLVSSNVWAI